MPVVNQCVIIPGLSFKPHINVLLPLSGQGS